jgi:hypothetical protein
MGYTTGLGEYLIYELFDIIKPQGLMVMRLSQKVSSQFDSMRGIIKNIETGTYIKKLLLRP